MNTYSIFKLDDNNEKVTLYAFEAESDDKAYEVLKKYKLEHQDGSKYYYTETGRFVDTNGKRYDTLKDLMNADQKKESFLSNILDCITYISCEAARKASDLRYWIRNLIHFIKSKHRMDEYWSLDYHLIDDLEYNIPRLIEYKHGVPQTFCEKARSSIHKDESGFNVKKSFESDPNSNDEELELAGKLWDNELNTLLLHVKLYKFYSNFGVVDKSNKDELAFYNKWKHTIPYKPGTFKDLDYKKLHDLENQHWNAIWNWIKINGRDLWD